jgi:hypothetical protein
MQSPVLKTILATPAVLALAFLGVSGTAGAATITAEYEGLGLSQTVTMTQSGNPLSGHAVVAGIYKWRVTGSSGDPGFAANDLLEANGQSNNADFVAFCIDPNEWLNSPSSFTVFNPLGDTIAGGGEVSATEAVWLRQLFAYQSPFDPTLDATTAAALAVAVWEIVGENAAGLAGLSVTNGGLKFSADSAVLTEAQGFVTNRGSETPVLADTLVALVSSTGQDMLAFRIPGGGDIPTGGDLPVPAPGTLLLLGLGLAAMGYRARRS